MIFYTIISYISIDSVNLMQTIAHFTSGILIMFCIKIRYSRSIAELKLS